MPLRELSGQASQIEQFKNSDVVTICRSGVRSTTAAAILTGLGFEHVFNLKDGMLDWNDAGLPVER
jgi:sulfur dioxygenase